MILNILIAAFVTVIVAYLILKNYKSQTVLMFGGIVLMACAILLGKPLLPAKTSTHFIWFDIFKYMSTLFSSRTAGLGLLIMAVAGFARYMDHIGASKVLVKLSVKPLQAFHAPYLVLALGYIVGQILNIFIPSASGLGLLLMATMFPILVSLGVSRPAATAMIGTSACLDLGPASGNAVLASKNAGLDVVVYFTQHQLPVSIAVILTIAIAHYFVQQWYDKKEEHIVAKSEIAAAIQDKDLPPTVYALLPIIPLLLILVFSKLLISKIKMDVVTAMLIGIFISLIFEFFRHKDAKKVFQSIQVFFDGMGTQFAAVITLIVAGEVFAKGLTTLGAIDGIIKAAQSSGFGSAGMIIVMTAVISISAVVMGSGNAPFFAFAAIAPTVAAKMGIASVLMLLPMQFAAGIARSVSPITSVIVAVSGVAEISPIEVVKRTAIPMVCALIVTVVMNFILF